MPCYHPVEVPIRKKHKLWTPDRPKYVDHGLVTVGCGWCIGCRAEQGRQWAVRMYHESQLHKHSWFLTLTYDNLHLPKNGSLVPKDLSRFIKDLRKHLPPKSVRWFGCGEYGETTFRPHYHAVLYGPDFLDRVSGPARQGYPTWRSETLDDIWGKGLIDLTSLNFGACAYVGGYVTKKLMRPDTEYYERVNPRTGETVRVAQEFSRCSLRPAIGKEWIVKWWRDVYPRDVVTIEGKQSSPPRYYDKVMEMPDEDLIKSIGYTFSGITFQERMEMMYNVKMKRIEEFEERNAQQLASAEKVHHSRKNLFNQRNRI